MNYQNEDDLKADGFVLTANVWHTGQGNGKVYEKVVREEGKDAYRVYFGVDVDGTVSPWTAASQEQPVVEPVVEPVAEVVAPSVETVADPVVEPAAEPVAEVVEPTLEPVAEPAAEPTVEEQTA